MGKCTKMNCPMQYDTVDENCDIKGCLYRTEQNDLRLYEMQIKNGKIDMTFGSEDCSAFIYSILQIFKQIGGENFVSTTIEVDGKELGGRYALTIQKVGGLTPIEKAREEIDRLNCVIADLSETIKEYEAELARR